MSTTPATLFETANPSDTEDIDMPKAIWVTSDGVLSVMDYRGTVVTASVAAGIYPIRPKRIMSATTSTVVLLRG